MTIIGLDEKKKRSNGLGATIPKMTQAEINADRERTVAIYKAGKAERDATVAKMAADAAAAKARANAADATTQAQADAAAAQAHAKWLAEVAAREQAKKQAPVVVAPAPNVVPVVDATTVVIPPPDGLKIPAPDPMATFLTGWNKGWADFFTSVKTTLGIK